MQKMMFQSQPMQTLYSGLLDVMSIYGRRRRVLEDIKRIEYSYSELLKMTLALGRITVKHSRPDECIGIILPNMATTLCLMERRRDPAATAVVLFTSGSEGKPKGVALSHHALLSNIAQIRSVINFSPEDKVLNALPIFHSFGLTGGALLPLMTGMNLFLFLYPTPLHYRMIPEIFYDRGRSVLFGTGTFLAHDAKFANPYDFYRLHYVVAGAEKLSKEVRELWTEKFGIRILEGYGATEAAPVLAVNTPMAYRDGTVAQFLPCIKHRLIPVDGIETGGMLHVRGPNLMSGYYLFDAPGKLQAPSSELGEGWYETGDMVAIDDDGFVSIVGRVKRFAKVAGEMVSLEQVEKIARQNLMQRGRRGSQVVNDDDPHIGWQMLE